MFAKNIGSTDRSIRIVLGIAMIAAFFMMNGTTAWHYVYLLGIVPLITGLAGSCPLYAMMGISTCPVENHEEEPL